MSNPYCCLQGMGHCQRMQWLINYVRYFDSKHPGSPVTVMHYDRYFPPVTDTQVFDAERSLSPWEDEAKLMSEQIFGFELPIGPSSPDRGIISRHWRPEDGDKVTTSETMPLPNFVYQSPLEGLALIPRPPGPMSKPGLGGWSLREMLGWSDSTYNKVQDDVHALCKQFFDLTKPYSQQDPKAIACEKFPEMKCQGQEKADSGVGATSMMSCANLSVKSAGRTKPSYVITDRNGG
ncbi:hypothetical protein BKA82DRAFT_4016178 [Pisolithus tinctorius]|nr:hypothetical protein BKA82DRAFT_4016178 [Pisolithus tinctorius]